MSLVEASVEDPRDRPSGEVFTRRWVVDLILDLAGYTENADLASLRAVEPACGEGAFLGPMVERLSRSCRNFDRPISDAAQAVTAFDLHADNVRRSRQVVRSTLAAEGRESKESARLANTWVTRGDYLLNRPAHLGLVGRSDEGFADFVIGNPPYIRPEDVPAGLYQSYRDAYPTMMGRADVYIAFFEAGLRSLRPDGVLAFICADRWMRNQYGRGLRSLVSVRFAIETLISMHDVDAFESPVSAYPAVVVIRNAPQKKVEVVNTSADFAEGDTGPLVKWMTGRSSHVQKQNFSGTRLTHWFRGADSWPGGNPLLIEMVEDLNERFAPIEDPATGTKVGIGVATGNDGLFVTTDPDLVESGRLLPLAMAADGRSGTLRWSGHFLVNPWDENGSLVDLDDHPRLHRYLEFHRPEIGRRHVAQRSSAQWYRTIDKVAPALLGKPKLLFPDMKLTIHPVLDSGSFYPHHNLYWITSEKWDIKVLGGLLMSRVAEGFVNAYCVKMRGGTMRFQAQYLRRIRVPSPDEISADDRVALARAFAARDIDAATEVAIRIYQVDKYRSILRAP